nr:hypothetical protein [Leptospira santarosai]
MIPKQKNKLQGTKFFSIARALIRVAFLACVIYSTYGAYIISTSLTPQPIYRGSETPQVYSDIFSSTRGYLCAPIVEDYSTYMSDRYEVCFLRLSAKDADWIRQKFASVKLGHVSLSDGRSRVWGQDVGAFSYQLNLLWVNEGIDVDETHSGSQEYMTPGMVFLRRLTLELWIDRMNPNDTIQYWDVIHDSSVLGYPRSSDIFYIPLQGNFLFYISEYENTAM